MAGGSIARSNYKLKKGLGATLDRSLSKKAGYPLQAHHLISCSVMGMPDFARVAKWAKAAGYDINRKTNGIAMPANFGHTRKKKLQRHNGGHDDIYYKKVRAELQKILDDVVDAKPCPNDQDKKDILAALTSAENRIRRNLAQRNFWLYDWSEELWEADYRDEGAGNLANPYGRERAYAAGIQWNADYPRGGLRRRHEVVGSQAVLRDAWYNRYGYPLPRSTT
jgi:hypothetical protein